MPISPFHTTRHQNKHYHQVHARIKQHMARSLTKDPPLSTLTKQPPLSTLLTKQPPLSSALSRYSRRLVAPPASIPPPPALNRTMAQPVLSRKHSPPVRPQENLFLVKMVMGQERVVEVTVDLQPYFRQYLPLLEDHSFALLMQRLVAGCRQHEVALMDESEVEQQRLILEGDDELDQVFFRKNKDTLPWKDIDKTTITRRLTQYERAAQWPVIRQLLSQFLLPSLSLRVQIFQELLQDVNRALKKKGVQGVTRLFSLGLDRVTQLVDILDLPLHHDPIFCCPPGPLPSPAQLQEALSALQSEHHQAPLSIDRHDVFKQFARKVQTDMHLSHYQPIDSLFSPYQPKDTLFSPYQPKDSLFSRSQHFQHLRHSRLVVPPKATDPNRRKNKIITSNDNGVTMRIQTPPEPEDQSRFSVFVELLKEQALFRRPIRSIVSGSCLEHSLSDEHTQEMEQAYQDHLDHLSYAEFQLVFSCYHLGRQESNTIFCLKDSAQPLDGRPYRFVEGLQLKHLLLLLKGLRNMHPQQVYLLLKLQGVSLEKVTRPATLFQQQTEVWLSLSQMMGLVLFLSGHYPPHIYLSLLPDYLLHLTHLVGTQVPFKELLTLLNSKEKQQSPFQKQVMQEWGRHLRPMKDTLVDNKVDVIRLREHLRAGRVPLGLVANYLLMH